MAQKLLYKYRKLVPWEHFLDILVNDRFYAARFTSLNDPMEGIFSYSEDNVSPSFIDQMVHRKNQFSICSLSETHNNTLMWSYYADSHKGVVLGLGVKKGAMDVISIEKVRYRASNYFRGFLGSDAAAEARKVLGVKLIPWKHEREIRVFSSGSFVPVSLEVVYLGCQMPESQKNLVAEVIQRLNPRITVAEMHREDLDREPHEIGV